MLHESTLEVHPAAVFPVCVFACTGVRVSQDMAEWGQSFFFGGGGLGGRLVLERESSLISMQLLRGHSED